MKLPKRIIRMDDGMEFILKKNGKYSIKDDILLEKKGHLVHEYSYEFLIGKLGRHFKIDDGTIDFKKLQKTWKEKVTKRFSSCGDD
jgi:hypothetical protein